MARNPDKIINVGSTVYLENGTSGIVKAIQDTMVVVTIDGQDTFISLLEQNLFTQAQYDETQSN